MDLPKRSAEWVRKGIVTNDQRHAFLQHEMQAGRLKVGEEHASDENIGATVLYALGGAVLGAAAVALVLLLDISQELGLAIFLTFGIAMLAAGLWLGTKDNDALTDALLVGSIVPFLGVISGPDQLREMLIFVPAFVGLAISVLRRTRAYPGIAGLIAFMAMFPIGLEVNLSDNAGVWTFLLVATAIFVAGAFEIESFIPWRQTLQVIGTAALTVSFMLLTFEVLNWSFQGEGELMVALAVAIALALGLATDQFGYLLSAAVIGAIDAIVFAFDLGGLLFGVITLILVAAALMFGAKALRQKAIG